MNRRAFGFGAVALLFGGGFLSRLRFAPQPTRLRIGRPLRLRRVAKVADWGEFHFVVLDDNAMNVTFRGELLRKSDIVGHGWRLYGFDRMDPNDGPPQFVCELKARAVQHFGTGETNIEIDWIAVARGERIKVGECGAVTWGDGTLAGWSDGPASWMGASGPLAVV